MNRSFASVKRINPYPQKHKLSQSQSSAGFRKILKNRSNHSNTSKDSSDSKYIERMKHQNRKSDMESMKQFVKSFQKIQKIDDNLIKQKQQSQKMKIKQSCASARSMRSSFSKCSERPKSRQMSSIFISQSRKLQDLEKKVENLIEQKLILTKNKTNFFKATVKTEEDELAKELSSIIQEIKVRKDEHDDKGIETETISDIARKIQILEKIIAQSYSQSQMFKKYFYKARSIRKSLFPIRKTNQLSKSTEILRKMSSVTLVRQKPSIYAQTISQLSFIKPEKKCYEKKISVSSKYIANRQPLPKTSYCREFLNYGNLPKYNYKQQSSFVQKPMTNIKQQTFYQSQFKEKKANLIDQNDLDCTHDKIRRLKVSFIPSKNKSKYDSKKDLKLQKLLCKKENLIKNPMLKTVSKTEFCREYTNKKMMIENPIKNKQLMNYKYAYKSSLNA